MSKALEAYVNAREQALRAALDSLRAERRLMDANGSVLVLNQADAAFCIAARDLARAADDLPLHLKPKGWAEAVSTS